MREADGRREHFFGVGDGRVQGGSAKLGMVCWAGVGDALQIVAAGSDGLLYHTIRNADGSWQNFFGLVEGQVQGGPPQFGVVGCAGVGDALQLVAVRFHGLLSHTPLNVIRFLLSSFAVDLGQVHDRPPQFGWGGCAGVGDAPQLVGGPFHALAPNEPLAVIRFMIGTGADDLGGGLNGSSATADVLLSGGASFTVTLRNSSEPHWNNRSTHTVTSPIPSAVNPPLTKANGIAGVRINLVQNNPDWSADNWDITTLNVSLLDPASPSVCQLNLIGTAQLQDGSIGLVRLSKNPGGSGNGPSSPIYSTGPGSGCH